MACGPQRAPPSMRWFSVLLSGPRGRLLNSPPGLSVAELGIVPMFPDPCRADSRGFVLFPHSFGERCKDYFSVIFRFQATFLVCPLTVLSLGIVL